VKKIAILVAGGSGLRMGTEIPKQFLEISGKPILMHTILAFYNYDHEMDIILVLPESHQKFWGELCSRFSFTLKHHIASGGETRFHSVLNGLKLIKDSGIVFIHDGVRPFVNKETLDKCFETAMKFGNAIPVLPVADSLRKKEAGKTISVDRSLYYSVQTPQTFQTKQIMDAFRQKYDADFTDDAAVAEKAGFQIFMVEGHRENIKITNTTDLIIAEAILKTNNPEV
jgi:2-C-methyl-D-erythritol 4-phosphate cytidylyltransferase